MLREVLPGAFVLVFLLCMTSFAVALTLGGGPRATTVELAIYQALRFDFDLGRAAWLALIQFALCGARRAPGAAPRRPSAGFGAGPRRAACGAGTPTARGCARSTPRVLVALALFLGLPLGGGRRCAALPALAAGLPAAVWPAAARSLGGGARLGGAGAGARARRSPALVDARRARGARRGWSRPPG